MKFLNQITPRQQVNGYGGNADSKAMAGTSGDLIKLTNTDKFARESLQNSCDASQSNFTSIKIRSISFNDALRRNYEEELAINSFLKPRIESDRNDFPSIEELNEILFVEDYYTWGLTETQEEIIHRDESRFYKFFFDIGGNDLSNDLGGAYGFGKAVYADNSRIRTIVAYSCSKEKNGTFETKLLGITKSPSYRYGDKNIRYSGFTYHGGEEILDKEDEKDGETIPLYNDEADQIALKLGFNTRERSDEGVGTSIAIVGLRYDSTEFFNNLKESIEIYWWKKIIEGELDVELFKNHERLPSPNPSTNTYLLPFIDSYEILKKRKLKPSSELQNYSKPLSNSKILGFSPGTISLLELGSGKQETLKKDSKLVNSIALFRKSGMVIKYLKWKTTDDIFIAGVFEANEKLNKLLRSSEPPNHWGWNSDCERIFELKEYKELKLNEEEATKVIGSIERTIRRIYDNFESKLMPESQINPSNFRKLDKLLTKILGSGKKLGGGGGGNPRDIRINHMNKKLIRDKNTDQIYYICKCQVYLDDSCKKDSIHFAFEHKVNELGDDDAKKVIDSFQSNLINTDAEFIQELEGYEFYKITKNRSNFTFQTACLDEKYIKKISLDYIELKD